MNKAFTLTELSIGLAILALSLTALVGLGFSYLSILNSVKIRYIALNSAQAGIEYAIALRNQQIERGLSPWAGVSRAGTYCLYFDTNTKRIVAYRTSQPCSTGVSGYTRLIYYSDFENSNNPDLTTSRAVRVVSEVYFGKDKIKLDVVLTRWHPTQ
jgi:prepilin-type N-terminal cleavage/methylation domain-containing protein